MFGSPLGNVQKITESLLCESEYQNLHHFLTGARWNHKNIMHEVGKRFVGMVQQDQPLFLLIDEVSVAKKGKKSAGVGRQYCGSRGKVDNCQVGVFSALSNGQQVGLINADLYLPNDWTSDPKRCKQAHIPEERLTYQSKIDIAKTLLQDALDQGIPFQSAHYDCLYGRDTSLLGFCDRKGITFFADIPNNQRVCLKPFTMEVPERKSKRGRAPKHKKPTQPKIKVQIAENCAWKHFTFRQGSKGALKAMFYSTQVWIEEKETNEVLELTLIVRKDDDGIKYTLTNQGKENDLKELAYMQSQRYFIERSFQDCKQNIGLAEYQTRSFIGYHRHMALCMMAMQFINEARVLFKDSLPKISVRDMLTIIIAVMPMPIQPFETIFNRIFEKHNQKVNDGP